MDSGAQLTVINEQELLALGIKRNSIFPLALSVNTVTSSTIDLLGGVFLRFAMFNRNTNSITWTRQLCYVSRTVKGIYLSEQACIDLGYVPAVFDQPAKISALKPICKNTGMGSDTVNCACPKRCLPPSDKPQLPCQPTRENLPKLKNYILNRYAASAFNVCERQPLPLMDGSPPLRLYVDKQATPVAVMTPATIPIHWE